MELHSSRERIRPPMARDFIDPAWGGALSWIHGPCLKCEVPFCIAAEFDQRIRSIRKPYNTLSKCVVSITLSLSLLSCGDGGTDPSDLIVDTDFSIELAFINHGTPSQDSALIAAADRWMSIVQGDLGDVDFSSTPVAANSCGDGVQHPEFSGTVDDLRIFIDIRPLDGPSGTLGQAGFCQIRTSSRLPVLGFMSFDSEDLGPIEASGDFGALVLHEMGHVLGVGTMWSVLDTLLVNPSLPSSPGVDTHFRGAAAVAAFNAAGGTAYTGGGKVPVENQLAEGSGDSHWRESVLENELMTPVLQSGIANPLSAITTESLADLGYSVDSSGADAFTGAFSAPARLTVPGRSKSRIRRVINLQNDTYRGPVDVVDGSGRVTRTIVRR
jgi:hypothetical protein